jgi:ClpP class serine protease
MLDASTRKSRSARDKVADGNYWLALHAKELGLVDLIKLRDIVAVFKRALSDRVQESL